VTGRRALLSLLVVLGVALFAAGRPAAGCWAFAAFIAALSLADRASLNQSIALGALLGLALGAIPESGVESIDVLGRLFIALLKMLIAPLILFAIVHGIAQLGGLRDLGRIGARTLALYLVTMAFAVLTGLVAVNLFEPGAGSALRESGYFREAVGAASPSLGALSVAETLELLLLSAASNPFASLAEGRILPIVATGILFGIALVQVGPTVSRPVLDVVAAGYAAVMAIIGWIVRLAPVGILALVGNLVASVGLRDLVENLLAFVLVVFGATLFHAAVTLPLVARFAAGVHPLELFRGIREALVVAFTTSSSAATLPVTTRCVEQNLGVPRPISSFVLPLGATVNMDGTALYEAIAALFVANVYGIELGLGSQLVVFGMAMLMSIGAPGIPSAGMVTMVVVLDAVGLPVEAVGILLTVDRLLDTVRTMTNVEGDAVVAVAVARRGGA
jgi:Na+/H+-dicarboxylate symporter